MVPWYASIALFVVALSFFSSWTVQLREAADGGGAGGGENNFQRPFC